MIKDSFQKFGKYVAEVSLLMVFITMSHLVDESCDLTHVVDECPEFWRTNKINDSFTRHEVHTYDKRYK